jgi:hypothetical protein
MSRAQQNFAPLWLLLTLWLLAAAPAVSAADDPNADGRAIQRASETVSIDWTGGVIETRGFGFVRQEAHPNRARRMALARGAAIADAQRHLAEAVRGLHITSDTTVSDLRKVTDRAESVVRAFVVGARPISEDYAEADGQTTCNIVMEAPLGSDGGFAAHVLQYIAPQVRVQLPARTASETLGMGAANWDVISQQAKISAWDRGQEALKKALGATPGSGEPTSVPVATPAAMPASTPAPIATPAPEETATLDGPSGADARYTGVLFDARGQNYAWNLYPAVRAEDGRPIYDVTAVANNLDAGFFSPFAFSPDQGAQHERTRTSPLTVSALGVDGNALIIANEDGEKLLELNGRARVLEDGRVLFIISRPE